MEGISNGNKREHITLLMPGMDPTWLKLVIVLKYTKYIIYFVYFKSITNLSQVGSMPGINSVICSRLFPLLIPSMPRPRYRITSADVRVVHRWIRERLRNDTWPEDWPRLTAWDKFPYEKPTVKALQRWCDRFLDTKQWKQLQAVIRSARRDPSRYRTVRLSRNAHEILGKLAMRDKLTLSKVVERYLSCVAHTPAKARLIKKIMAGV